MGLLLIHGPDWDPGCKPENLLGVNEFVEFRQVTQITPGLIAGRAAVLVLDPGMRLLLGEWGVREAVDQGAAVVTIGAPGEEEPLEDIPGVELITAFIPHAHRPGQLRLALRTAFRESVSRRQVAQIQAECALRTREIQEITRVSVALSTVQDYDELLQLILSQTRQVTQSDAGSLYLVEAADTPAPRLRFKLAQNDTLSVGFKEHSMPLDHYSLAGHVCLTGEALLIDDVYFLPPDVEYCFQRSFDERNNYRSKSVLTVPLRNRGGEAIGALQLINRKRDPGARLKSAEDTAREVIPFSPRQRDIVTALAGQAGVSIENSLLYQNIEQLFEGFVQASVTAIEQRDPPTRGHSIRVANTTVGLAEVVDRGTSGPYRRVPSRANSSNELQYAGLLHDFGKVGVREQVLIKEKKLYGRRPRRDPAAPRHRGAPPDRVPAAPSGRPASGRPRGLTRARWPPGEAHRRELDELDRFLAAVLRANEPTILSEGSFEELQSFAERTFLDPSGIVAALSDRRRASGPVHPQGLTERGGASGNREPRAPHRELPADDPLDAGSRADPDDRLRPPREAQRARATRATWGRP